MEEIISKIKQCDTIPKLDSLRIEIANAMMNVNNVNNREEIEEIRKVFIKQKNKLKRIPLKDRKW